MCLACLWKVIHPADFDPYMHESDSQQVLIVYIFLLLFTMMWAAVGHTNSCSVSHSPLDLQQ